MSSFNQDLEKGKSQSPSFNDNTTVPPQKYDIEEVEDLSKDNHQFGSRVLRVTTSSAGDVIHLGNQSFHKSELLNAFGGDFNPGVHPPPHRPMGNPVPLGLVGFAICTFTVGFVFCGAVDNPQLLAGPSLFLGGAITTVAGFWCLVVENTFASCALGAFGGFYLSYAAILIDAFGITSAYADEPDQFNKIMGFFLLGWFIYAFSMWLCTFKATWSFFLIIGFVVFYLLVLMISYFADSLNARKGAGVFAILSALSAFYAIFEGNATPQNSYIVPPQFPMPHAPRV